MEFVWIQNAFSGFIYTSADVFCNLLYKEKTVGVNKCIQSYVFLVDNLRSCCLSQFLKITISSEKLPEITNYLGNFIILLLSIAMW